VHWGRIIRNVFSNWTSYLVTAVVGFLLSPIVVHVLGSTGYGLWTLMLSVTGYFGLLDLGIRSSVSRFLARHLERKDDEAFDVTASTAFAILGCGGVLALAATIVIALFFLGSFDIEPAYQSAARTALLITGLNMSCILPLGVFSAILYASERFDIVSGITIVTELVRAALVVTVLRSGDGLVALAIVTLTITAVQYTAFAVVAKLLHRRLSISPRHVDLGASRELFGFSVYRFIWIVANQLIFYSDAVVIGIVLGAAAVTPYAIAVSLISYGRQIVFLVLDPFYPSAARMDAKGDRAELQRLLLVGTTIALIVVLPLCFGFVFLGRHFITLWMGEQYAESAVILTVLALAQFVSLPQYVSTMVLAGMARHRPFAYIALGEGAANLVLSIVLVHRMGVIGVAWGTVIPALISNTLVVPLYTLSVLQMPARTYFVGAFVRPLLCAVPMVAAAYGLSRLPTPTWLGFVIEVVLVCGVFGVASYFGCLYSAQRAAVLTRIRAFLRQAPAASEV
jgi:O-antigen/teichoic acid export membrane protein